jgi:hypothetical protein
MTRRGPRSRPLPMLLAFVAALTLLAAGCGGGGESQATVFNDCQHWCGTGSANVAFRGFAAKIPGGGCYDQGEAGIDARFGDWQGISGSVGFLQLIIPAAGAGESTGATDSSGGPAASQVPYDTNVIGSVGGEPFVLGPDAVVRISPDGTGSFSGTDVNGGGVASGTFSCR